MIEVPPVALLPSAIVHRHVLQPMLLATGGSMLATQLAVHSLLHTPSPATPSPPSTTKPLRWAVNLSGGYHHASAERGGGFCIYADITLAIVHAHHVYPALQRVLIVDLDAHQGNGHETDLLHRRFPPALQVTTLDLYNPHIYPHDTPALRALLPANNVPVPTGTKSEAYLRLVRDNLARVLGEGGWQLVVYNAGTDILEGDGLGRLAIDRAGVVARDEEVFRQCRDAGAAVVMLMSGGVPTPHGTPTSTLPPSSSIRTVLPIISSVCVDAVSAGERRDHRGEHRQPARQIWAVHSQGLRGRGGRHRRVTSRPRHHPACDMYTVKRVSVVTILVIVTVHA